MLYDNLFIQHKLDSKERKTKDRQKIEGKKNELKIYLIILRGT